MRTEFDCFPDTLSMMKYSMTMSLSRTVSEAANTFENANV